MAFRLLSTDTDFFFPFSTYTIHTFSAWNSSAEEDEEKKRIANVAKSCACGFVRASSRKPTKSCPETLLNVLLAWVLEFGMFSRVCTRPASNCSVQQPHAHVTSCAQDVQRQTDAVCLCPLLAATKPKRTRAHARAN